MCVHDKYTPVATCKRNKPQHENTKAFLFSYVNKSPDGSFVRLFTNSCFLSRQSVPSNHSIFETGGNAYNFI